MLGSAQPVLHQLVTQSVAAGKPPGQAVRMKLQRFCSPSMAIAGPESSQLAPKGSLGSQSWAATWLRGEIRKRMWSERMVDGESNACFGVIERAEEGEVEGYAGNCFGRKERESAIAAAGAASKYVAFGSPSAERGPTESIAFQPRTCKGIACSSLPERGLQVKLRRDAELSLATRLSSPKEAWLTFLAPQADKSWRWTGWRR